MELGPTRFVGGGFVIGWLPSEEIASAQNNTSSAPLDRARIGVHSDLHREHLLVDNDGSLTGVLDFGDAFIGSIAWDFALLNWYYRKANAAIVARHHVAGSEVLDDGVALSIAVGLYKVARKPDDPALVPRLRRCLEST